MAVAMLTLLPASVLLATLLLASDGLAVVPLVIVTEIVAANVAAGRAAPHTLGQPGVRGPGRARGEVQELPLRENVHYARLSDTGRWLFKPKGEWGKDAMSEIREVQINRRQAMGAAGAAGVLGLMPHLMHSAASESSAVQPSGGQLPLPKSSESNKFNVFGISPQVIEPHGTVTKVTGDNFPVLKGNQAAVFYLVMKPGAVREPHWHPDAWELDVPLSGNGRLGVVNPNDTWSAQAIKPGSEIGFVPQGYAHYIENIGKDDVRWMIVFNNTYPDDIGLSTMFGGMPTYTFTQTFGLPKDGLAGATKPNKTLFIV